MDNNSRTHLVSLLTTLSEVLAVEETTPSPASTSNQALETNEHEPALISVQEAARILGLSRASAYRLAAENKLPVKRFGRRVYVIRGLLTEVITPDVQIRSEADAA